MKNSEYIKATNRVKISIALTIIRDVLPGDDYGISEEYHALVISNLMAAEKRLFAAFECDSDDDEHPHL